MTMLQRLLRALGFDDDATPAELERGGVSRRAFLGALSLGTAGFLVDPASLLWKPGGKTFFLPSAPALGFNGFYLWDPIFKTEYLPHIIAQLNEENLLTKWMRNEREQWVAEKGGAIVVPVRIARNDDPMIRPAADGRNWPASVPVLPSVRKNYARRR